VHAALVLELAVDTVALDQSDDLLVATEAGVAAAEHLDLPALFLGVAAVHAEQIGGEQRRLFPPGSGADFEHGVALVVRVLWQEKDLELRLELGRALLERRQLLFGELADLRVVGLEQILVPVDVVAQFLPLAVGAHDRLEAGALLRQATVVLLVTENLGIDQLPLELGVSALDVFQFLQHRCGRLL